MCAGGRAGASLSMPARAAAARTTSHSTLGDMPSPHTRPALLMARKTGPCVITAAAVHASTAVFTHVGIGTVRTCPPLPTKSAITQCSSRCWIESRRRANNSARRSPQPINIATIAWSRNSRGVEGVSARSSSRRPCSGVSQFPSRTPMRRTPFTRRMPAASSGLRRPASAASYATRRTAASRRLMVAGA